MIALLAVSALAGEPTAAVHAVGVPAPAGEERASGAGLGGAVGWSSGLVGVELAADAALGAAGPVLATGPQLRVAPLGVAQGGTLWVVGGAGVLVAGGVSGIGTLGLDLDLDPASWARLRLGASYAVDHSLAPRGAFVRVGLAWPTPAAEPESTPAPEPVVVAPPKDPLDAWLEALPPGTTIWVPHPYCVLLPATEAAALLATLPPGEDVWVSAPGRLATRIQLPLAGDPLALAEAPVQGSVVVVAWPGDVIHLDAVPVSLSDDAVAVVTTSVGEATVTVTGGGRSEEHLVAVSDGYATWVRAGRAPDARVLFELGSSTLDAGDRAQLAAVADSLGAWSLDLIGSFSPEGSLDANLALGNAVAQAVAAALAELGVPADRLRTSALPEPDPSLPPDKQRAVRIVPLSPRGLP